MDENVRKRIKNNLKNIDDFITSGGSASRDEVLKAQIVDALSFIANKLAYISSNINSLDLKTKDKNEGKGKTITPLG